MMKRNFGKYLLSASLLFASALTIAAQDAVMNPDEELVEINMPAPLEKVDSAANHITLLNEAQILPLDEMYPVWRNSGVHYSSNLPDSFRIDLSNYCMPTPSTRVTDIFGYRPRRGRVHQGLDIKVYEGDTLYAAFEGKVRITAYQRNGYGHYVVIRHTNGIETLYAHMSRILVDENETVKVGQPIGLGGNTGRSTGSHLHFETILMGMSIDPALLFDFPGQKVTGDSYVFRKADPKHSQKLKGSGIKSKDKDKVRAKATKGGKSSKTKYHSVKRGDTIGKIAKKHGVSQKALLRLNGLKSTSVLRPGQKLRIK